MADGDAAAGGVGGAMCETVAALATLAAPADSAPSGVSVDTTALKGTPRPADDLGAAAKGDGADRWPPLRPSGDVGALLLGIEPGLLVRPDRPPGVGMSAVGAPGNPGVARSTDRPRVATRDSCAGRIGLESPAARVGPAVSVVLPASGSAAATGKPTIKPPTPSATANAPTGPT